MDDLLAALDLGYATAADLSEDALGRGVASRNGHGALRFLAAWSN